MFVNTIEPWFYFSMKHFEIHLGTHLCEIFYLNVKISEAKIYLMSSVTQSELTVSMLLAM